MKKFFTSFQRLTGIQFLIILYITLASQALVAQNKIPRAVPVRTEQSNDSYNDAFADLKGSMPVSGADSIRMRMEISAKYNGLIQNGITREQMLDYKGALAFYSNAIELLKDSAKAYVSRAGAKLLLKDYKGSESDYSTAILLDKQDLMAYKGRAIARLRLNDEKGSLTDFNIIPGILNGNPKSPDCRGDESLFAGNYLQAVDDYTAILDLNEKDKNAYRRRGEANFNLKNYPQALADYSKAIRLDPTFSEAYINRGITRHRLNQDDYMLMDFNKALVLGEKIAAVYIQKYSK